MSKITKRRKTDNDESTVSYVQPEVASTNEAVCQEDQKDEIKMDVQTNADVTNDDTTLVLGKDNEDPTSAEQIVSLTNPNKSKRKRKKKSSFELTSDIRAAIQSEGKIDDNDAKVEANTSSDKTTSGNQEAAFSLESKSKRKRRRRNRKRSSDVSTDAIESTKSEGNETLDTEHPNLDNIVENISFQQVEKNYACDLESHAELLSNAADLKAKEVSGDSSLKPKEVSGDSSLKPKEVSGDSSLKPKVSGDSSLQRVSGGARCKQKEVSGDSSLKPKEVSSDSSLKPKEVSSDSSLEKNTSDSNPETKQSDDDFGLKTTEPSCVLKSKDPADISSNMQGKDELSGSGFKVEVKPIDSPSATEAASPDEKCIQLKLDANSSLTIEFDKNGNHKILVGDKYTYMVEEERKISFNIVDKNMKVSFIDNRVIIAPTMSQIGHLIEKNPNASRTDLTTQTGPVPSSQNVTECSTQSIGTANSVTDRSEQTGTVPDCSSTTPFDGSGTTLKFGSDSRTLFGVTELSSLEQLYETTTECVSEYIKMFSENSNASPSSSISQNLMTIKGIFLKSIKASCEYFQEAILKYIKYKKRN